MSKPAHKTALEVFEQVQRLNADERDKLNAMLAAENGTEFFASPEIEQAWIGEIEHREQLFRDGKNRNLSWDEAREQVMKRLDSLQK